MGHKVGPEVTSGSTPAIHAGLNTKVASYSLTETASGSTTIAICSLPGGAVVTNADLNINTNALALGAAPGDVSVKAFIGGNTVATYITSQSGNAQVQTFAPAVGSLGVRLTSSANLVVHLTNLPGSGTASTVFTTVVQYTADQDPD